jgi:glycerol-3-phosphate acyltransferase PlsY
LPRLIFIVATSYLLGSIPFGYLLVRIFRGEDVRRSGSGNIGATNVSRKSPVLGVLTLVLDALKGLAAVACGILASLPIIDSPPPPSIIFHATFHGLATAAALAALCAIVGHAFPVWLKFRGGKGVATGLGSFVMIAPKAVLIAAGIFLLVVLVSRYVSLGSVISVASFPSLALSLHEYGGEWSALALMGTASLLIVLKHWSNIQRLLTGTEQRFGAKRS